MGVGIIMKSIREIIAKMAETCTQDKSAPVIFYVVV